MSQTVSLEQPETHTTRAAAMSVKREHYPEAERYIREGQEAVTHRLTGNPLLSLFMAGVAGYALAWMIHGQRRDRETRVPDHARTGRGYAPHREN